MDNDTARAGVRGRVVAVAVTTVIVAFAAGLVAAFSPSSYVSTVSVLVGPVSADVDTLRASESLTSTYSQLILRPEAVSQAAASAGVSYKKVTDESNVSFNTDTRIVTLTVTTDSSAESRRIASSLTSQLTGLIGTIDPTSPGAVRLLTERPQTAVAVERSVARYALLGGVGWLLLSVAVLVALAAAPPASKRHTAASEREGSGGTSRVTATSR